MKRILSLLFLSIATFLVAGEIPEAAKANIRERIAKSTAASISMALVDKDGVTYFSAGKVIAGGPDATENHVYEIGSVTKTFTGLLLADMIRKGEVALNDPIAKFLPPGVKAPEFNGKQITLAHLATHRSSLPRMPDNMVAANPADPYADYDEKLLYAFLDKVKLNREIGSVEEYSNFGMGLLGCLLARAAGVDYATLLRQRILEPLGMKDTWLTVNDKNRAMIAPGHSGGKPVSNWELNSMGPAGAIKASAAQMARYVSAQLGLTKSPLQKAMVDTQTDLTGYGMGLAWFFEKSLVEHNGATGGYRAYVGLDVKAKRGVVILVSGDGGAEDLGHHILDPQKSLKPVYRSLDGDLQRIVERDGVDAAIAAYRDFKANKSNEYRFEEPALNSLGYSLLGANRPEDAVQIFRLNVEEYPQASNPPDSLGEAYAALAVKYYKRALELDPSSSTATAYLERNGVPVKPPTEANAADLEAYLGRYQLAENMIFSVTRNDTQLMIQLTGQQAIPVYHRQGDLFYAKVVSASISFNRDSQGKVTSLTLHQNGDHNAPRLAD